jgi:hypothetical protein
MMQPELGTTAWAQQQFGHAVLGDSRRTARLVQMGQRAAEFPAGKLCQVFSAARELDAAYDFVESDAVGAAAVDASIGRATAELACEEPYVFVAVDGSSASLTDTQESKGFGSVGTLDAGSRGLKVISALAIDSQGATLGLVTQTWWTRLGATRRSRKEKRRQTRQRKPHQKETRYWLETITRAAERLQETGARAWFQLDREADAWPMLLALEQSGHHFTVRAAWDRLLASTGRNKQYLRGFLGKTRPIGAYTVELSAGPRRSARAATLVARAARVELALPVSKKRRVTLRINAVWVTEKAPPSGEKPLDWLLLTNTPITTAAEALSVVKGYTLRWRIEDFHKSWKSGGCNVEQTQLRSPNAVVRWATILAAVATRIERIKHLGRTQPDTPATLELTPLELRVLIVLKKKQKKRTETVPDGIPTISQAMRWIADLGGYTGVSSGGPPGSITLARGYEKLIVAVQAVEAWEQAQN